MNRMPVCAVLQTGELMHPAAKLIIGIIIFLAGIYWYAAPILGQNGIAAFLGVPSTFGAFVQVFAGLFGLVLIGFGLIVAWIEWEDWKWERKEKAEKAKEEAKEHRKK